MPIRDLAADEAPTPLRRAEICIIGAGMAGLLLARRLAKAGMRVVVVESGGLAFDEEIHALNAVDTGAGRYARALTNHYRGLGGTSSRWGGRTISISPFETGPRPHLELPGWPLDAGELAPYREEVQQLFGLGRGSFEEDELAAIDPQRLFPRHDPDYLCRWAKWPDFRRCNLATVLGPELRELPGLEIWLNATVTGFGLDREAGRLQRIDACNFAGRQLSVEADEFVVAAGTIESTRLLLWLRAISDGHALARTQVLGNYFQDHLNLEVGAIARTSAVLSNRLFGYHFNGSTRRSMHLELSPEAQIEDGAAGAFAYVAMDFGNSALAKVKAVARGLQQRKVEIALAAEVSKDLGLLARSVYWRFGRRQLYVPPDVSFRLQICIEQKPVRSNRLRLGPERDRLGLPKPILDWHPTEGDERTFRSALRRIRQYWHRAGFDQACPILWAEACTDPDARLIDHCEDYAHPSGSTRMGLDPRESVVGGDLRCHDLPNVSVASASTFPAAGSANPSLTIMALALRLGDRLIAERRRARAGGTRTGLTVPAAAVPSSDTVPG